MYHKVDVIAPTRWWVSRETFALHMDALQDREVVYLSQYDPRSERRCVITFDDAYENIHRHALPILRERGLPFEVFVNGDLIGRWNRQDDVEPLTRYCGLGHLRDLAANGGRIQWHTGSHPDLTRCEAAEVDQQIAIPTALRREFPDPHLTWFAYPFGAHSPSVVAAVRERFAGAVSVLDGSSHDRFQLNRVVATEDLALLSNPGSRMVATSAERNVMLPP